MAPVIVRIKLSFPMILLACVAFTSTPAQALFSSKTKTDEEAGAVLFRDKGCAYCHGIAGMGGKKAPALTDIRKDKAWTPAKMTDQILNGGQKMPFFRESLSDEEIAQLVAYLRSKNKPIPPPSTSSATPPPPAN